MIKSIAFKILFAFATFFKLNINHIDVKIAFLYGFIDQLIYMEIPKSIETETTKNMIYKLLKALYDLK